MENQPNTINTMPITTTTKAPTPPVTTSTLVTSLEQTFYEADATIRRKAEQYLNESVHHPGFTLQVLGLINQESLPLTTRLAAGTFFKNLVKKHWEANDDAADGEVACFLPDERREIRSMLLDLLLSTCDEDLRNMLAECFRLVVVCDYPYEWPTLVDALAEQVKQVAAGIQDEANFSTSQNVLVATYMLAKRYEFFQNPTVANEDTPKELEDLVDRLVVPLVKDVFVPLIEGLKVYYMEDDPAQLCNAMSRLDISNMSATTDRFFKTSKVLLKLLYRVTRSYFPSSLKQILPEMSTIVQFFLKQLNHAPDDDEDEDDEQDEDTVKFIWGPHKRTLQLVSSFVSRHHTVTPDFVRESVSTIVSTMTRPKTHQRALPDKIRTLCFDLIDTCCDSQDLFDPLIKPHMQDIVMNSILSALEWNDQDEALWEEDPDEYMLRNLEFEVQDTDLQDLENCSAARKSAMSVLVTLMEKDGTLLDKLYTALQSYQGTGESELFATLLVYGQMLYTSQLPEETEREVATCIVKYMNLGSDDMSPKITVNALWAFCVLVGNMQHDESVDESTINDALEAGLRFMKHTDAEGEPVEPMQQAGFQMVCTVIHSDLFSEECAARWIPNIVDHCVEAGNCEDPDLQLRATKVLRNTLSLPMPQVAAVVAPVIEFLSLTCEQELEEGEFDGTNSESLAALATLSTTLEGMLMEEDSDEIQEAAKTLANFIVAKLPLFMEQRPSDDEDGDEDGEPLEYSTEITHLVRFVACCSNSFGIVSTNEMWSLVQTYMRQLPGWADTLSMLDEEWSEVLDILRVVTSAQCKETVNVEEFMALVAEPTTSVCETLMLEDGTFRPSRAACQFLISLFSSYLRGWDHQLIARIASMSFNRLNAGTRSSSLKTSLVLVLCHCYYRSPEVSTMAMDDQGVLDDFLRFFVDVLPNVIGHISSKVVVLAGVSLLKQVGGHDTAAGRRMLASLLDGIVEKVVAIQSGELEEQRNALLEEEAEDEEEDASDEEEDEEPLVESDETEEEFRARYAQIAQDLEDNKSCDGEEDEQVENELLLDQGDEDGFKDVDAVAEFKSWLDANGELAETHMKRKTSALVKEL